MDGDLTRLRSPAGAAARAHDPVRAALPPSRLLGPDGPLVMGIVNVTPDSFSDGGRCAATDDAVAHGLRLWAEGADWVDVGGESTRPGGEPVPVDVERARVLPVVRGLVAEGVAVSVDTRRAVVARAAVEAGAVVVNDVSGGDDPEMAGVVAAAGCRWVLMHHRGVPVRLPEDVHYDDLVGEVRAFLAERVARAEAAGVPRHRLLVDAGLGFAKATEDNARLIAATRALREVGCAVVVGASRKRFVGHLSGVAEAAHRVHGSVGAALAAALHGADVLRVHDVAATIQALRVFRACVDA